MMMDIHDKLREFHKQRGCKILDYQSQIMGEQFPGEFNVSGFHSEVQELAENPGDFWGVDRCMRLKDDADATHSYIFSMGIFAKGIDLKNSFSDPFKDSRFREFQEKIINQFVDCLQSLGIKPHELEATYFNGLTIGASKNLRDKILRKKYDFPKDTTSKRALEEYAITCYPVNSLANIDIHPFEEALVGTRVEVAYRGIEIGTIVFDCFKIKNGRLVPINYVGGYAIGIERLVLALSNEISLQKIVPAYRTTRDKLKEYVPSSDSSLLQGDVNEVIFSLEVLATITLQEKLSRGQKKVFRDFKKRFYESSTNLGLTSEQISELTSLYQK